MPTILRETYPTAKKEHRCEFCCEKIAIGENLNAYVYANHYDEHTDDVYTSWQLNHYEIAKKILKELKTEK